MKTLGITERHYFFLNRDENVVILSEIFESFNLTCVFGSLSSVDGSLQNCIMNKITRE